jgi:glycosyltransferase involved in cell wall biosynthesis
MKITHVIWSMTTGGAELMLVDIINEQQKSNKTSLIIINQLFDLKVTREIDPAVEIKYLKRKPKSKSPLFFLKLFFIIRKINPDIIHAHEYDLGPMLRIFKRKKSKLVETVHQTDTPIVGHKYFDMLFSISPAVKRDLMQRGNIESIILDNGIVFNDICLKDSFNSIIKIIQVGRLDHKNKGQDILLNAFHKIYFSSEFKNLLLIFIGEGGSEKYLKNLTNELNLNSVVEFRGLLTRKEIYSTLKDFDIFVQPSNREGFGLTVVEAMAAKLPVLISDVEGPMEIIEKGKYGFYFKAGDVDNCAIKLMEIIDAINNDPDNLYKITRDARQHVINNYNITRTVNKYIDNYNLLFNQDNFAVGTGN